MGSEQNNSFLRNMFVSLLADLAAVERKLRLVKEKHNSTIQEIKAVQANDSENAKASGGSSRYPEFIQSGMELREKELKLRADLASLVIEKEVLLRLIGRNDHMEVAEAGEIRYVRHSSAQDPIPVLFDAITILYLPCKILY